MKIPKKFKLGGMEITVEYDPELLAREDAQGAAVYRKNKIIIQPSVESQKRSKKQLEHVFLHELVHYILDTMGEHELRTNERHVDLFATFLHQALTTME